MSIYCAYLNISGSISDDLSILSVVEMISKYKNAQSENKREAKALKTK
jgi:hypothetical protein